MTGVAVYGNRDSMSLPYFECHSYLIGGAFMMIDNRRFIVVC